MGIIPRARTDTELDGVLVPKQMSIVLAVVQILAFTALFVAAWFLLGHWQFVVAVAIGALAASLYIEVAYLRDDE